MEPPREPQVPPPAAVEKRARDDAKDDRYEEVNKSRAEAQAEDGAARPLP